MTHMNTTNVDMATLTYISLFMKNTIDVVKATIASILLFKGIAGKNGLVRQE